MVQTQRIRGLGAVKPHVKAAAEEIAPKFNVWHIGGFATSGHISNSDHYKGLALDVMTTNGQPIADWAQANAARLGITYIIWNRRIWDSRNQKGWAPYVGSSPHTDHVHISFSPQGGTGGAEVGVGASGGDSGGTSGGTDNLASAVASGDVQSVLRILWNAFLGMFFGNEG